MQAWDATADLPAGGPPRMPGALPTDLVSPVVAFLRRAHERHLANDEGTVATYIPELGVADPEAFGIVVATVDGAVYEVGDTRTPFTIQSMAKPLTYATILDIHGVDAVRDRIGVEPTGDAFNAISLSPATGMPLNPMVNAGAITAVGMVPEGRFPGDASRTGHLLASLGRFAGRPLAVDEAVYRSERDTGHRNRAIANLLRGTGALDDDPEAVLEAYFRLCSVAVDARDLALIAATLAAGGRHPLTGAVAAGEDTVRDVLSVMATCGMYDGAGEWLFEVGLPAKSGVSGGIFAVLPGQIGIGVWSPRLDARGNSVRGVAVCRDLAKEFDLHLVRGVRPIGAVRTRTTVARQPSKRGRTLPERERLTTDAGRSLVLELQGAIGFVAVETLAREATADPEQPAAVVIDLRRAIRLDPAVTGLVADLVAGLGSRGSAVAWSGTDAHEAALERIDDALAGRRLTPPRRFVDLDLALEWAEDVVLSRGQAVGTRPEQRFVPLVRHPAMAGLGTEAAERFHAILERRTFRPGDALVRQGEPAEELFLVTGGRLSVWVQVGAGEARRLATLEAGGLVGELAFLGREQ
ncbi:MAG TPA: glutaminase A, partial [Candidatus Limnocylindrales bacterium]|nr:glutaminase A [Candidatus Limnocylindrales bacterium]